MIETMGQFFNDRDFGVSATFNDVSAGTSTTVKGIFDNESALVEASGGEEAIITWTI